MNHDSDNEKLKLIQSVLLRCAEQETMGSWKKLPVTIGLLIAIIGGGLGVISIVRAAQSDRSVSINGAISAHNRSVDAHGYLLSEIRNQSIETRKDIAKLREEIKRLHASAMRCGGKR